MTRLRARWTIQIALEHASRGLVHFHERAAELGVGVRVFALRHRDAIAFGHQLERFEEADALDFHDELEQVATLAAAEAPVELMARMHGERRRFFGVERAQPGVTGRSAGLLQAHVFTDDFDDVDGRFDLLGEIHARYERPYRGSCCSYR